MTGASARARRAGPIGAPGPTRVYALTTAAVASAFLNVLPATSDGGGQVSASTAAAVTYTYTYTYTFTFTLGAGPLTPGTGRTFAAQLGGTGTAHPTAGDTWTVTYTAGGQQYTQRGTF